MSYGMKDIFTNKTYMNCNSKRTRRGVNTRQYLCAQGRYTWQPAELQDYKRNQNIDGVNKKNKKKNREKDNNNKNTQVSG